MTSVFIPKASLGVLTTFLREGFEGKTKRHRQVSFKETIRVLTSLNLLPRDTKFIGVAEGVNYLGEQGFWIVQEAMREVVEGPQTTRCPYIAPDGCESRCIYAAGHSDEHKVLPADIKSNMKSQLAEIDFTKSPHPYSPESSMLENSWCKTCGLKKDHLIHRGEQRNG